MPDTIEALVLQAIAAAQKAGELPEFTVENAGVERPADTSHGEWTSTVALRSARAARMAPAKIAQIITSHLPSDPSIAKVEIAGPGFINFYLNAAANNEVIRQVREQGDDFGRVDEGHGLKVNYEFISANPTGPLHVGHGRWVALGDSMCNVLEHANYKVCREYYINDHGSQMDVFGGSVAVRYTQLVDLINEKHISVDEAFDVLLADREAYVEDEADEKPETHRYMDAFNEALGGNAYGGDYIIEIAREFYQAGVDKWASLDAKERTDQFRERAYQAMMARIKATIAEARCPIDMWFSERSLYVKDETGTSPVDRAFARLEQKGHLYKTDDGALWFRSTTFGDDKDRVLIKSNGEYTYFASDVAYHWDKLQRDDYSIDLWGADHHGYIARVTNVCDALGYEGKFEVDLGQFVNLLRSGQPVRMSKRKGTMVTFQELINEVGVDATRYTLVSKSSNQTIDFDIEAVKQRNASNPVFYVQYAHARICSILRRAAGVDNAQAQQLGMDAVAEKAIGDDYNLSLLTDPTELQIARKLNAMSDLIASAARDRAPFRLTHYLEELASDFHAFYNACQVLPSEGHSVDRELSHARLAACDAVRRVLALNLKMIGVSAPTKM